MGVSASHVTSRRANVNAGKMLAGQNVMPVPLVLSAPFPTVPSHASNASVMDTQTSAGLSPDGIGLSLWMSLKPAFPPMLGHRLGRLVTMSKLAINQCNIPLSIVDAAMWL